MPRAFPNRTRNETTLSQKLTFRDTKHFLMKITNKGALLEVCKHLLGWINIALSSFFFLSYCNHGNEARPILDDELGLTYHVTQYENARRGGDFVCLFACRVWCANSSKCQNSILSLRRLSMHSEASEVTYFYDILNKTCYLCSTSLNNGTHYLEENELHLFCRNNPAKDCHIFQNNSTCFVLYCLREDGQDYCSYFNENVAFNASSILYPQIQNSSNLHLIDHPRTKALRHKRNNENNVPYFVKVTGLPPEVIVFEPLNVTAQLLDDKDRIIRNVKRPVKLIIEHVTPGETKSSKEEHTTTFFDGIATFVNVCFKQIHGRYNVSLASEGSPTVRPWSSVVKVQARPLVLKPSGKSRPISSRENDTLSPAAGVVIYDVKNNTPAHYGYLSQYTWQGSIGLLYDDVYPGDVSGNQTLLLEEGANEMIFDDVVITEWGYSYVLRIEVHALETTFWDMTCLIGPFDVDKSDLFDQPLVESSEFRNVRIVFDGDFAEVSRDQQKFEIFFLNYFGRKYGDVRWKNVSLTKGSVIVDAIITGLTENLERTSKSLSDDIKTGKADISYLKGVTWKAKEDSLHSRKLLQEKSENADGSSDEGGLSVAWIAAIVINVILIVAFIIAIVYCYCRRKRQREVSRPASTVKNFTGNPDPMMFANKAENGIPKDKTALINNGPRAAVFTIEEERRQMGNQRPRSFESSSELEGERCTCVTPRCYCSVGDGRKTTEQLSEEEENENDPEGYPTPSPQPRFPTPLPTPEPEDYWRPDSREEQEQEPEEEEEEDIFLPGAVSEPIPEPPQDLRHYVYNVTDSEGSRELIGHLMLPVDSYMNDVRNLLDGDSQMSRAMKGKQYKFLRDNLESVPNYQESSLALERLCPTQEILVQYLYPIRETKPPPTPKPRVIKKPKVPAYVGPLGICNTADCTRAAKIKCLDCRNVAYCTKRCMREDQRDHKRLCYKPAWRL